MMAAPTTFAAAIAAATESLAAAGIDSPRLDAEVLLANAAGADRARLILDARRPVPDRVLDQFDAMLQRRLRREPLQYILGTREFWSLDFFVTPAVLIPRPETEGLIEAAIDIAKRRTGGQQVCDVGTGSGCIAIVLARELPAADVCALDISPTALEVARGNCARHEVTDRVHLAQSDLLASVAGRRFDLIVSNPPYAAADSMDSLQAELEWEPRNALDGGERGMDIIRLLVAAAPAHLVANGWLLLEIGFDQEAEATALFDTPVWRSVEVRKDLQGLPRVVVAQRGDASNG